MSKSPCRMCGRVPPARYGAVYVAGVRRIGTHIYPYPHLSPPNGLCPIVDRSCGQPPAVIHSIDNRRSDARARFSGPPLYRAGRHYHPQISDRAGDTHLRCTQLVNSPRWLSTAAAHSIRRGGICAPVEPAARGVTGPVCGRCGLRGPHIWRRTLRAARHVKTASSDGAVDKAGGLSTGKRARASHAAQNRMPGTQRRTSIGAARHEATYGGWGIRNVTRGQFGMW